MIADLILKQRRGVSRFLAAPEARVLRITVAPEYEILMARVLQTLEEGGANANICFGFEHSFHTPDKFYSAALAQIQRQVEALPPQLRETLTVNSMDWSVGPEAAFGGFLDRIAASVARYADYLVFSFVQRTSPTSGCTWDQLRYYLRWRNLHALS